MKHKRIFDKNTPCGYCTGLIKNVSARGSVQTTVDVVAPLMTPRAARADKRENARGRSVGHVAVDIATGGRYRSVPLRVGDTDMPDMPGAVEVHANADAVVPVGANGISIPVGDDDGGL